MHWLEMSVEVDGEATEAVAEVLRRFCQGGVAIEEAVDPEADEGFRVRPGARVVVRGYLPLNDEAAERRLQIEQALFYVGAIWPIGALRVAEREEEEWATAWKQHYHPIRVGRRLLIKPAWSDRQPAPDEIVIELDPGMAFGTGLHPTTQLCLRALEDLVRPGMEVLDLGTGSGILSIAAARLGASSVLALDVDPVAVDAARMNVATNGLGGAVLVEQGSLPIAEANREPRRFDLVVANIIAQVIADLADELAGALRTGGTLVASGIIDQRAPLARARLEAAGFVLHEEREGDWIALIGRIPEASHSQ